MSLPPQSKGERRFESGETEPEHCSASTEQELDALRTALEEARIGVQRFSSDLDRVVARYRSERAWSMMLRIRKGYTLLRREGMTGRWKFLRWMVSGFAASEDLTDYEIPIPRVEHYLPPGVAAETQRFPERGRGRDIVVLPVFDFSYRFQRPQHMALQLARLEHRVFWISPTRLPSSAAPAGYEASLIAPRVAEIRLRGEPLDLHGGEISDSSMRLLLESLSSLIEEQGIEQFCVLVQFPFWGSVAVSLRERYACRIIYDCMDDWQHWPASATKISSRVIRQEELLARDCDLLIVSSQKFLRRFTEKQLRPLLVRNAADFEFFSRVSSDAAPLKVARPVIGYYGAIAPWFDLELMENVARSKADCSFVLIGKVEGVDAGRLRCLPNVHFAGEKHYRELPSLLASFDVAVIPFRINELTCGVDPVKAYEYLSQGKQVVATPLPELEPARGLIRFAATAEAFAAEIDSALQAGDEGRADRIAFARQNTWATRAEQVEEAMQRWCDEEVNQPAGCESPRRQ